MKYPFKYLSGAALGALFCISIYNSLSPKNCSPAIDYDAAKLIAETKFLASVSRSKQGHVAVRQDAQIERCILLLVEGNQTGAMGARSFECVYPADNGNLGIKIRIAEWYDVNSCGDIEFVAGERG